MIVHVLLVVIELSIWDFNDGLDILEKKGGNRYEYMDIFIHMRLSFA